MNQTCKVCGEPAAGFHFGAFTCEGCKSFFGRSYNNLSSINECKNNGKCVIDKKNRTTCKACRLRKCYTVGMSKGGSRYGRRSNWFKIHCLLQEQQSQAGQAGLQQLQMPQPNGDDAAANGNREVERLFHLHRMQQTHQGNGHLSAAHHMALLGYPSYLTPDLMQTQSPFMSAAAGVGGARGSTDSAAAAAAAAAALPLFGMMPQSAFQLPPQLLFPTYHPSAAAVAAADAAYRTEMFKHRQSVDSAISTDSQHYSTGSASRSYTTGLDDDKERSYGLCKSPELCVSGDEHNSFESGVRRSPGSCFSASLSPVGTTPSHPVHSPIPVLATSKLISPLPQFIPNAPTPTPTPTASESSISPIGVADEHHMLRSKLQSLSPLSVTSSTNSIGVEACVRLPIDTSINTNNNNNNNNNNKNLINTKTVDGSYMQDCPMDLSMKASRNVDLLSDSDYNTNNNNINNGFHSDCSEEELHSNGGAMTRKFYCLSNENVSEDVSSSDTSAEEAIVKRPKRSHDALETSAAAISAPVASQNYNVQGFAHNSTSLRGIFVCV